MRNAIAMHCGVSYSPLGRNTVLKENQKFTKTDSELPIDPDAGASLTATLAPIFLKSVFGELPDGMSRWSFELVCEILRVPTFVRFFFILSIQNLDLQSGVCCIK